VAEPNPTTPCGVLVTGHGQFASGLVSALELIMGPQENLVAVDFPKSDTATQLKERLAEALGSFPALGRIAVFCDLRGGSPFNVTTSLSSGRDGIEILFGANLPTLIQFISRRKTADTEALVTGALDAGAHGLGRFAPAPAGSIPGQSEWD
jgi:N-acetylgalactosamine PTS system EIIA component